MEKLIELLWEWKPNFDDNNILDYMYSDWTIFIKDWKPVYAYDEWISPNVERMIISKKEWFIKWLVWNNMVNLDKLKENTVFTMFTHCVWIGCEWNADSESVLKAIWTDALIAYTSIQDKPIDFLISILK